MKVRVSGHSAYRTEYHVVWVTKYRRRLLNPGVQGYCEKTLEVIMREIPECEVLECNFQIDHVHMVIVIPPSLRVSDVVGQIKQSFSRRLRKKFPWISKIRGWDKKTVWSTGYFVTTVGIDEEVVLAYVKWQGRQDSGRAQLELKF